MSVTLDAVNVLWLKGRARMSGGNVSDTLDKVVTSARLGKTAHVGGATSVVGMVDLKDDPDLLKADGFVRAWFDEYLSRPFEMNEDPPQARRPVRAKKKRG